MLKAEDLVKSYGKRQVLSGVECQLVPGQCLGVLGPNGSGKSTLLQCFAGAQHPDQGKVWLDGKSISRFPNKERAKQIAVLPQGGALPLPISVEDYLLMGREPYQHWWPWYQHADYQLVDRWVKQFGLENDRAKTLTALSGGERQRVAIAQAMVQSPNYLLLDEPMNHLDIKYQYLILELLMTLKREQRLGIMIILHDINLAAQYCDQLLFLQAGKVVGYGTPYEVINQQLIAQVYGIQPIIIQHPQTLVPQILLSNQ